MEQIHAMIRELDDTVRRNVRDRNADAMVEAYYADDARVLPPGGGEIRGKAAIRTMWRELIAAGMVDLALETDRIEVDGDLVCGTGTSTAIVDSPDAPPKMLKGRYTVVFRRQADGSLRNIVDMYTIDSQSRIAG